MAGLKNAASECYIFTHEDSIISYYLDENNMPYILQNGNRMPMALPLEHLRVTDETVLSDLNMLRDDQRVGGRSYNPSSYFDMTNGGTYTDTFLINGDREYYEYDNESEYIDIRYYVDEGSFEFYSLSTGGRNLWIENRGDSTLNIYGCGSEIKLEPGKRVLALKKKYSSV